MTMSFPTRPSRARTPALGVRGAAGNLRGSLYMVAAMAAFALEDPCIKLATASVPVWHVLAIFGTAGALAFAGLARRAGEPPLGRWPAPSALVVRCAFEVVGRPFFTLSLAYTALSAASAILQATPLVVAAGSVLFFGERVGWRRRCAIGCGFAGVLLIVRPGLDGFTAASPLAVVGTIGFAGRDLATRASPPIQSNRQLGVYGCCALASAGLPCVPLDPRLVVPSPSARAALEGATAVGVLAYAALTAAMRTGEVSVRTSRRRVEDRRHDPGRPASSAGLIPGGARRTGPRRGGSRTGSRPRRSGAPSRASGDATARRCGTGRPRRAPRS